MKIPKSTMFNWEKQEGHLRQQTKDQLKKNYFIQKEDDYRKIGKFPKQQEKTLDDILDRRFEGKAVSTKWIRLPMKMHCEKDKPKGYDKTKNKFTQSWVKGYMKRKNLSIRRKTNRKKTTIWEKIHKIENYHWFVIYKMADDPISEISETDTEYDSELDGIIQF